MSAGRKLAWIWLTAGVPIAFLLFVAIGYQFGPRPFFSITGDYIFVAVLTLISLSGAVALRIALHALWGWGLAVVYFFAAWFALPWVGLIAACFNGDCI